MLMVLFTMSRPIPWTYLHKLELLHTNYNGLINNVLANSVDLLAQIKIITQNIIMVYLTMFRPIPWTYWHKLKLLHTNYNSNINDVSANSVDLLAQIKIITNKL